MDKRIILAVAGSGKTTHIVNSLSTNKRSLIITYTISNLENLSKKILHKFDNRWPENITLMSYFQFLFHFCYKPFLSDTVKAHGIFYQENPIRFCSQKDIKYYLTSSGYFYSNRLSLFLQKTKIISDIKCRIEKYFDEIIIDEVQDIAGRDFNFLEDLMSLNVDMLFVGDFFQHTYDTSRDGNVNKNLFSCYEDYIKRFKKTGFIIDTSTLKNSWRCGKRVCAFVSEKLGIQITSNRNEDDDTHVFFIEDSDKENEIINDDCIIKLHYNKSHVFGLHHKNWGDSKGEDCYNDVCVVLNKKTFNLYRKEKLNELETLTRNKLYVAIARAHGNVYLIKDYK